MYGDDTTEFLLESIPGDGLSRVSYSSSADRFGQVYSNYDNTSDWITLDESLYYKFEARHREYGWTDFMSTAVEFKRDLEAPAHPAARKPEL